MTDNNTRIRLDPPRPPATQKKAKRRMPYAMASTIIIIAFTVVILSACAILSGLCVMFAFDHAIGMQVVRIGTGGLVVAFCLIALATVAALIEGMARNE